MKEFSCVDCGRVLGKRSKAVTSEVRCGLSHGTHLDGTPIKKPVLKRRLVEEQKELIEAMQARIEGLEKLKAK